MRHEVRTALIVTLLIAVAALVLTQSRFSGVSAQTGDTVTLNPVKDNTIFSESGNLSSGAGRHLFAGQIGSRGGNAVRRALIKFDVAGNIPAGSTVSSARLTMRMSKTNSSSKTVSLHKITADWGEAPSDSGSGGQGDNAELGDATWNSRILGSNSWTTPGGDFIAASSAAVAVGFPNTYSWEKTRMAGDVQAWLDDPNSNFGWILIGDESSSQSVKKFDSRENSTVGNRPTLTIEFEAPAAATPLPTDTPTPTPTPSHTPTPTVTPIPPTPLPTPEPIICGDVSGDRVVNVVDGVAIMRIIADFLTPTASQLIAGDIVRNGAVDVNDAIFLLQFFVGKVDSLGGCGPLDD